MIAIENLTFGYKKKSLLYENFSFYLEPGRVCGLLGKNGVGKSTLLYLICGLLRPQSGKVLFRGFHSFKRLPSQTRELFLVPEEFDLPKMPLSRYVKANATFYPRFSMEELEKNLDVFGMDLKQDLGALSMGQKKKIYMSFALATGVSLLVMDEPTNGLDIPGKSQFRKLIARNMNDRRSILISTHQVADIDRMLDQVVILDEEGVQLDESVKTLCEKLLFVERGDPAEFPELIYSQPTLEGCGMVLPNHTGQESRLNLELLFNAMCTETARVQQALHAAVSRSNLTQQKPIKNQEI